MELDEETRELLEAARDEIRRLREGLTQLVTVSCGSPSTRPEMAHWYTEDTADLHWECVSEYAGELLMGSSAEYALEHARKHMLDEEEIDTDVLARIERKLSS